MKNRLLVTACMFVMTSVTVAQAAEEFPAQLVGHALLPAQTLVPAPADAPDALKISGKFTERGNPARLRNEPSADGAELPFLGQPVQGFSGIRQIDADRYYVLTDNGFGTKANSPDAMLFFHIMKPDFKTGDVLIEKTTFLRDPNKVIPFNIAMEGTDTRYLTGSDLDLEGFQVLDGKIFIGEEFGPFIIVADAETGVVEAFHETYLGEKKLMSPDHFALRAGDPHKPGSGANVRRSRGYEGFAASVDGKTLYPLLEGPVWDEEIQDFERVDGNTALRLMEFDVASQSWTGKSMLYRLEADNHAIGDFNMIDETRGLVIERDGGQGDAALACKDGATENCFRRPAIFKRVYMIDMKGIGDGEAVRKVGYIDLMNIQDFDGIARLGRRDDNRFTFPFVTIENVDRVDEEHIIVANDNNFPFSKGRDLVKPDNNEFILLKVSEFLKAAAD